MTRKVLTLGKTALNTALYSFPTRRELIVSFSELLIGTFIPIWFVAHKNSRYN